MVLKFLLTTISRNHVTCHDKSLMAVKIYQKHLKCCHIAFLCFHTII